jgi:spore maturation protein CgeB
MCDRYDLLFAASRWFADDLAVRLGRPVIPLLQATDPERFHPGGSGPRHELLFVGNSRGVRRQILDDLRDTPHDLAVYGRNWSPSLLDPRHLRGEWVANDELAGYYAQAAIVLADHWPDMRDEGFIANRIFDAAAAGAFVISDDLPELEAEFDGGVVAYRDAVELKSLVDRFLADPVARLDHAGPARSAVLARHTFGHRADVIVREVSAAIADRQRRAPAVPVVR